MSNQNWLGIAASLGALALVCPAGVHGQTNQGAPLNTGDQELQEIVVQGYKSALLASQKAKRESDLVIEAITPTDLGKFADASISDELKRLPGVQVDPTTDGRGGDHISVRGMGPEFVTMTFNGRTATGYGFEGLRLLREFDLAVFPTEILSGAKVYKTSSAELPEAGLGGEVNFDTLRPLDYLPPTGQDLFGSITGAGSKSSYTNQTGDKVSAIVGGKFFDNTFGAVIAVLKSKNPYLRYFEEQRSQPDTPVKIQDAAGNISTQKVIFPSAVLWGNTPGEQDRQAATVDLQWKPTENLDVNLDYTYSGYDRKTNWNVFYMPVNSGGIFTPGGITTTDGAVTGLNYADWISNGSGAASAYAATFPYEYRNDSKVQLGGLNATYHSGKWTTSADVGFSKADSLQSDNDLFIATHGFTAEFPDNAVNYTATSSGPSPWLVGAPPVPLAHYDTWLPQQRYITNDNSDVSARLDVSYQITDLLTLKAGSRYTHTDVDVRNIFNGVSPAYTAAQIAKFGPILFGPARCTFAGVGCVPSQNTQGVFNFSNGGVIPINRSNEPFNGPFSGVTGNQGGQWNADPAQSHANTETTTAFYVQATSHQDIFGTPASTNVGARVVRTSEEAQAYQSVYYANLESTTNDGPAPGYPSGIVSGSHSYTNVLPAANVTLHPRTDINLRASIAETLSRPEFEDMSPINSIGLPDPAIKYPKGTPGIANTGNVDLKPETTWNYDLTAEWYGKEGTALIGSVFYKSVKNFIVKEAVGNSTLPGFGSQLFGLTEAANVSSGKAYGAEFGISVPFKTFNPVLDGFGGQINYTYVLSRINQPLDGHILPFIGSSKENVNGTLYYSKGAVDARVAAVYRSSYLSQFPWVGVTPVPLFTDGTLTLDGSFTYSFGTHFDVTLTGTNLTRQNRRDFTYNTAAFLDYYSVPRTFTLSFRAKL